MGQVILAAVGDMSFGEHLLTLGDGVRSVVEREGREHVFRHVREHLDAADLVFGNFEGVITEHGLDEARPLTRTFRASRSSAESLAHARFNVVNVANNHTLQYGAEGFADTLQALREAGLDVLGVRADAPFYCAPLIKHVNGLRIGFLGYSQARENFFKGQPLYADWDDERIAADVHRLRPQVDFLIVSCHWGVEQVRYAQASAMRAARRLIDLGVDIVLGHHAHVFQPVESYRHGLVFYGLGNFVFDTIWEASSPDSAIARIHLNADGDSRSVSYDLVPVRINDRYQPVPLQGAQRAVFLKALEDAAASQDAYLDRPDEELQRMAAQAEANLAWRKIGFVLGRPLRVHRDTWRVLVLDKVVGRLRPRRAARPSHPGGC